jgi:hypothetical protein
MQKYCQNKTHTPNILAKLLPIKEWFQGQKVTWMLKQITQVVWIHGWDSKSLWFKIHRHTMLGGIHNCNKTIMLKTSHQKQVWLIRCHTWE